MKLLKVGMAALALLLGASRADAATIVAFEQLEELLCSTTDPFAGCDDLTRDLFRTRQNGSGPLMTEDDDPTIASENAVPFDFGRFTNVDFSYTHDLSWLLPISSFQDATLTIWGYDVDGGNDAVKVGIISLGSLNNGNSVVTSTQFGDLELLIIGNMLTVSIDKHPNNTQGEDSINIFRSLLSVEYDDNLPLPGASVPEPATVMLLGAGLASLAARRRRQRAE